MPHSSRGTPEVEIDGMGKMVRIRGTFAKEHADQLTDLLIAWHPSEMSGIATVVITHGLNINPIVKPMAQRKRMIRNG